MCPTGFIQSSPSDYGRQKKNTNAKNLLFVAVIDTVTAFGVKDVAKEMQRIPLSNNSISRKIQDISYDKSSMTGTLFT